ncbi:MAG TPA: FAD-binding oxidoreductase [Stellaceae bacterium]|jgi:D-lactate dehydrogenase (cytochrome)|nr:FAD-binding oxidoreductase [Stellaceae bacterium]
MTTRSDTLDRLHALLGDKGFIADSGAMEPYLREERGTYHGAALAVLRPTSTEEVAAAVKLCAAANLPIFPQGGNTGLAGGAVPWEDGRGVVLSLSRMNRVRDVDPIDYSITVEAGVILADVQTAATTVDRLFPLSLGAEGSCQIGGNISTNAGGIAVLRYGNTRSLVLGLEVVLPDGRIWHGLRALRKDNTGYDLKQLFIGGEGTLGIVTAATLRLFPLPKAVETAFLGLTRVEDAMDLFSRARKASGDQLTAFELISRFGIDMAIKHVAGIVDPLPEKFPWYVLLEVSSSEAQSGLIETLERFLSDGMEAGLVKDGVIAKSGAQARDLWRIREGLVEAQKFEGGSIKHDISVPVSKVAAFITRAHAAIAERLPGIRPNAFGHVGDGNIHYNIHQPEQADKATFLAQQAEFNRIVHDVAVDLNGSISAEHGIGRLKVGELAHYKEPIEIEMMRRVKQALDPHGIMNPGKILAP